MIERIRNLNTRQLIGAVLLIVSTLLLFIPIIPFLPLELGTKAGLGVTVFVIAEATGYPGLALLGKETVQVLRQGLRKAMASLRPRRDWIAPVASQGVVSRRQHQRYARINDPISRLPRFKNRSARFSTDA